MRQAGETALASGQPQIIPPVAKNGHTLIAYPVASSEQIHGVIVLALADSSSSGLQRALRELHWGVGWILSLVWQHKAASGGEAVATAPPAAVAAMELLAAVQEKDSLQETLMAFANEVARAVQADRVAIGLVRHNSVKLAAMSHGAWFRKRSDIVELIEAAMDEAHDQHARIVLPHEKDGGAITIQHARLSAASASGAVASIPFEDRGIPSGVLTIERDKDGQAFTAAELLLCETAASLVAPTISLKQREARLFSGRIRNKAMDGAQALFGPRRPLAKAVGIAALLLAVVLLVPLAQFRVSADAALEGRVQRAAAAPFDGFIARSSARAGDTVQEGEVLATLDDRDLRLDHARAEAETQRLGRQYRKALAEHNRAEMNIYGAQLRQAESELRLMAYKLDRVNIVAPFSGVLVSGDVSQLVGSPVEEGKVLFEVAPLDDFRVVLNVQEGDIAYLESGQKGRFAPAGLAGETVAFTVTKLTSVTDSRDGNNTFRVEAELDPTAREMLRPGMEGVAKVDIDRRSLLGIWTRPVIDWLRLFAWKWLP
ncbi:efflux RND transporter periplasmic adaptor subunit [Sphingomonas radiodurans]|uniref:efflux RND transporter periplasmic adaptor subunit n=1 Tax=Sphingomonas radiodurans TaxID=2890321 RepID=UPI001E496DA8|nr:HlyD family efflux transporter periplasmic adaptor subunit [Sphingomonas radiodurans]WBH15000.1 HlyD family efflux transporter periplasmic adaptor subunit [Sphingomonas radiodurans]